MTDIKKAAIEVGARVRIRSNSVPFFLEEVNRNLNLLRGMTVRFYKPGFLAFGYGLHGGPAWWSETNFEQI